MGLGFYGIAGAMMKGAQEGADRVEARKDKEAQMVRQAEQDEMRKQEFEERMKEVKYQEGLRNAAQGLETARLEVMKNKGTETSEAPVIQVDGKTYEAPSLDPANLPKDTGVTGGQGVVVKGVDGVQQAFGTAAEAQAYKDQLTPSAYSIQKKLQEKFAQMPGGEKAATEAAQRAQMMQKEGMFDVLRFLSAGQPEQAVKAFEAVGSERIPPGAKFVPQQGKDPITGAEKTTYAMVDPAGKVIIPNLHEAVYGYVLDPVKRLEMEASKENAKAKAANERDDFIWKETVKAELRGNGGAGGKPVGPDITTVKSENGDYLYDKNSGAIGREIPPTAEVPEERPWFGPVKPAKPATPGGIQWTLNGKVLPNGPQSFYDKLPVNRAQPQDGTPKAPGSTPTNAWNDATGEVISNGRVIGKAKSKEEARALLAKQPRTGATNASERAMSANVAEPMGADPQAIAREIQRATADLQKVSDASSIAQLRQYITSLQGQLANIKG